MSLLIDQIRALLVLEKLNFDEPELLTASDNEAVATFRMPVKGLHGEWVCIIRVFADTQRILVYSIVPRSVPETKRIRMAELLVRINYGLVLGNFEMDWDDGELRYKTSMDIEGITPTADLLRNLVFSNFFSTDRYIEILKLAIDEDQSLSLLLAQAESQEAAQELQPFEMLDHGVH